MEKFVEMWVQYKHQRCTLVSSFKLNCHLVYNQKKYLFPHFQINVQVFWIISEEMTETEWVDSETCFVTILSDSCLLLNYVYTSCMLQTNSRHRKGLSIFLNADIPLSEGFLWQWQCEYFTALMALLSFSPLWPQDSSLWDPRSGVDWQQNVAWESVIKLPKLVRNDMPITFKLCCVASLMGVPTSGNEDVVTPPLFCGIMWS